MITWVGSADDLPSDAQQSVLHDFGAATITPGLVDPHTHVVFSGLALDDFTDLLGGMTPAQLRESGRWVGGMVRRTREASEEMLLEESLDRVWRLIRSGITSLESKSGAGLDRTTELRMLRVNRTLAGITGIDIQSTFLGAHARPDDWSDNSAYIQYLADSVLPEAAEAGLVDAVDGFCDPMGFSPQEMSVLFDRAVDLGVPVKLHAEQYRDFGAADLVASYRGLSADHCEYLSEDSVARMAAASTVAVLLPGPSWILRELQRPPVAALRSHGVAIALASNCNPISSPTTSPAAVMHLAAVLFGLTPEESLAGFTLNAARALGMQGRIGSLESGKQADLAVWQVHHPDELTYWIGHDLCTHVVKRGRVIHETTWHRIEP